VKQIRRRARQYGVEIERGNTFPQRLESILNDIAETGNLSRANIRQVPTESGECQGAADIAELVVGWTQLSRAAGAPGGQWW
jgi:hypothetical protein